MPLPTFDRRVISSLLLASMLAACGGRSGMLEPRYVAVHNAMIATGASQTGPVVEGSLLEGAEARVTQSMDGGACATFVAFGSEGVRDLDVVIADEQGEVLATDGTHDRQPALQFCAPSAGSYEIRVRMVAGQGSYVMTAWSSSGSSGGTGGASRGPGGGAGCGQAQPLEFGRSVQGETTGTSNLQGSCAGDRAPERVYRLVVERRAQVTVTLQSAFDGALYISRQCGRPEGEVACNDDAPDTTRSEITAALDPGTYFVVVDGYGDASGTYELIAQIADLADVAQLCQDAQPIAFGQPVSGSTTGQQNSFQATCANNAASPDRVYYFDVAQRSRVRVTQQSDHDGVLYLRRACADQATELACNDDYIDRSRSLLTATLDAGRYFLFTDGYSVGQAGNYTITVDAVPDGSSNAAGDACASPISLAPGQRVDVDVMGARDDLAGTCGGQNGSDVVYQLQLSARSRVRATVTNAQFSGAIYVQSTCGGASTACTPFQMAAAATLDTVLPAGRHFLVIDGQSPDQFGSAQLEVNVEDVAALERSCREAPMLRSGQAVSGNTSSNTNRFQASCADGTASPDTVYRIQVRQRQRIRLQLTCQGQYDGALHLRRACADASSELACNDDNGSPQQSLIETTVDAGTYFVIVDGYGAANSGAFSLQYDVLAP